MDLIEFLALEAPFLLPAGRRDPSREALLRALEDATALEKDEAGRSLYPGVTAGDAAGWSRTLLRELVEGWFRRQDLKATITADERKLLLRTMVLSRELDD
jgi:hypothetical protein